MASGNSVLVLQKCVNSFSGCLWGMFSNQQLGSLKIIFQFSGCLFWLIHHKRLALLPIPLRPAERSILFSEKSVRLSDDAQSAASSHAPKKGCGVREVWRSQTCTSGSPFFCLLFFGEAKKSKCPVGTRRMVKANRMPTTNRQPIFRLPQKLPKGSLKVENSFSGCL